MSGVWWIEQIANSGSGIYAIGENKAFKKWFLGFDTFLALGRFFKAACEPNGRKFTCSSSWLWSVKVRVIRLFGLFEVWHILNERTTIYLVGKIPTRFIYLYFLLCVFLVQLHI